MTKYTFLSVLTEQDLKPIKDSFTNPFKNKYIKNYSTMGGFNLDGAYYFSKAIGESSMWMDYRRWLRDNKPYSERDKDRPKQEDMWLESKDYYYADIDLEAKGIYVINTPSELRDFFVKYVMIHQEAIDSYDIFSRSPESKKRYDLHKINKILIDYLIHLSPADRALLDNITTVNTIKNHRNRRNMSLVKVSKGKIIIDKRKTHFGFLIDLVRTIEYNDKIIGDPSTICTRTRIGTIDYNKLHNDGYNGLYYSDNLVKVNSKMAEEDFSSDFLYKYVDKIDIDNFPDIIGDSSVKDLIEIKREIENFVRWLGSDTLLIWDPSVLFD